MIETCYIVAETGGHMRWYDVLNLIGSILSGIGISAITLYLTYLRFFSKHVTIAGIGFHHRSWEGDSIRLTLRNHAMRTFFIREVYCVFDDKYAVKITGDLNDIIDFNSRGTLVITQKPFSSLHGVTTYELSMAKKVYAHINTTFGTIKTKPMNKTKRRWGRKKSYPDATVLTAFRQEFNGKLVMPSVKYALVYWPKGKETQTTVFIHKGGHMSEEVRSYDMNNNKNLDIFNAIPKEIAASYDRTRALFEEVFAPFEIVFVLHELKDVIDAGHNGSP